MNDKNDDAIGALKEIALEGLKEQKRARRWGIFFKLAILAYVIVIFSAMLGAGKGLKGSVDADEITAVVDINGIIMDGGDVSSERVIQVYKTLLRMSVPKA